MQKLKQIWTQLHVVFILQSTSGQAETGHLSALQTQWSLAGPEPSQAHGWQEVFNGEHLESNNLQQARNTISKLLFGLDLNISVW